MQIPRSGQICHKASNTSKTDWLCTQPWSKIAINGKCWFILTPHSWQNYLFLPSDIERFLIFSQKIITTHSFYCRPFMFSITNIYTFWLQFHLISKCSYFVFVKPLCICWTYKHKYLEVIQTPRGFVGSEFVICTYVLSLHLYIQSLIYCKSPSLYMYIQGFFEVIFA
jgi:hypothetical protein